MSYVRNFAELKVRANQGPPNKALQLTSREGAIVLERAEVGPEGTPADEDVPVNVTVDAQGFAAADQSWIVASDWATFLAEFEALTERRQGKAALVGASPEDLRVEFFSTDRAGHMAVQGHVKRSGPRGFNLELRFGFAFEPDELPRVLAELRSFTVATGGER
ncbi:MAG: hypothetical protein SFV15_05715 [Polyangiaceae bacterium]|nr:hypothetical protein [Polyangiaceae bacterium]